MTSEPLFSALIRREHRVTSTMDVAQQLASEGAPHGTSIVATCQTAGRGRAHTAWLSEPGAGLWGTLVLRLGPAPPQGLTLVLGAAVLQWVHQLGGTAAQLKWPNDLWAHDGKLGGILCQAQASACGPVVLAGIGINTAAPPGHAGARALAVPRVGLKDLCPPWGDDAALWPSLVDAVQKACVQWQHEGLAPTLKVFEAHHRLQGAEVQARAGGGAQLFGTVVRLAPDGGLVLATATGEQVVYAGEVTQVRPLRPTIPQE